MDGNETTRSDPPQPAVRRPAGRVPDRQGDAGRPGAAWPPGASDYITKPVDLDELLDVMARGSPATASATARDEGDPA